MLIYEGEMLVNDGEMLVNDGEMSIWSHFSIIDEHFTIIDEHFTIIYEHFTILAWTQPSFAPLTIIEKLHRLQYGQFPPLHPRRIIPPRPYFLQNTLKRWRKSIAMNNRRKENVNCQWKDLLRLLGTHKLEKLHFTIHMSAKFPLAPVGILIDTQNRCDPPPKKEYIKKKIQICTNQQPLSFETFPKLLTNAHKL